MPIRISPLHLLVIASLIVLATVFYTSKPIHNFITTVYADDCETDDECDDDTYYCEDEDHIHKTDGRCDKDEGKCEYNFVNLTKEEGDETCKDKSGSCDKDDDYWECGGCHGDSSYYYHVHRNKSTSCEWVCPESERKKVPGKCGVPKEGGGYSQASYNGGEEQECTDDLYYCEDGRRIHKHQGKWDNDDDRCTYKYSDIGSCDNTEPSKQTCVYTEGNVCKQGNCLDGSQQCGYNVNCGYISGVSSGNTVTCPSNGGGGGGGSGPVCNPKQCVYYKNDSDLSDNICYEGRCLNGTNNCSKFGEENVSGCGVPNGCFEGNQVDCYKTVPVIPGAGDVGNATCDDQETYCDASNNTTVWKHGGRKATQQEINSGLADENKCVYAFTPQGSCNNGSSNRPTIKEIQTAPDLKCKSSGANTFQCDTPQAGSSFSLIAQVDNHGASGDSQCYWKIKEDQPDIIARSCNLNRNYKDGDYFSVQPTNSTYGAGASVTINFKGSESSSAGSCPAQGSGISILTGTKAYPENNQGHCGKNYGTYSWCTNPKDLTKTYAAFALDVWSNRSTNVKFVLPSMGGKNVNWQKAAGPYDAGNYPGDMGACLDYQGSNNTGDTYFMHACHFLGSSITSDSKGGPSGTVIANQLTTVDMDGAPHLHFTISKRQSDGSWKMQEPDHDLNMCP